jgi:adenosylcobyric acid synthase
MEWLIESGLEGAIIRESANTRVIGICGGFQLLGKEMHDPDHVEHGGDMRGLGLLDTKTVFAQAKTRTRITGTILEEQNLYGLSNREVEGYEIHMGTTENLGGAVPMITLEDERVDALSTPDGRIWGSYLHGIFDNEDLVFGLVHQIMKEKGINPDENHLSVAEYKEIQYDKLADLLRTHLDMDYINSLLKEEEDLDCPDECKNCSAVGCGGRVDAEEGLGCVHIYCGDGKGKTTASTGLAVRCAGAGHKVLMYQFIKNNDSSEVESLGRLPGITRVPSLPMKKFTFMMDEEEKAELKDKNDAKLEELIALSRAYDMIVLDEAVYAIDKGLLSEEKVLEWLKNKPRNLEVVLTGRNPSEKLQAAADYVSEIKKIKHPFDMGLSSRVGIEK